MSIFIDINVPTAPCLIYTIQRNINELHDNKMNTARYHLYHDNKMNTTRYELYLYDNKINNARYELY